MPEKDVLNFLEKLDDKMDLVSGHTQGLKQDIKSLKIDIHEVKEDVSKLFIKLDETAKETTINAEALKYAQKEREGLICTLNTHVSKEMQKIEALESNLFKYVRDKIKDLKEELSKEKETIKTDLNLEIDNKILQVKNLAIGTSAGLLLTIVSYFIKEALK